MKRLSYFAIAAIAGWTLVNCSDNRRTDPPVGPDPEIPGPVDPDNPADPNPLELGQTSFVSEEAPGYAGSDGLGRNVPAADAAGEGQNTATEDAPGGREGAVEEADIYRVRDNRLYYLNTYRGFLVYDLSDTSAPRLLARLPVLGYPIEMFVEDNTVYALLRDVIEISQEGEPFKLTRKNESQLVAIDISDPRDPRILSRLPIIGNLREGVSRKIGDTIYVVSHIPQYYRWGWRYPGDASQEEQAWVYSFNVSDPSSPRMVEDYQIFKGGSEQQRTSSTCSQEDCTDSYSYHSRNFAGIAIGATANALMVVENWYTYDYQDGGTSRCGSRRSGQEAKVSIVDISDEEGDIRLHTEFTTDGHLGDQFKHTYRYDPETKQGTYIGIFAVREWNSENCTGSSVIKNIMETWDVTDGQNPERLGSVEFGKPNETVRGSAFDPKRQVAYAITARAIDPLYVLSYADRDHPDVLSQIDNLSGDMNVFRLIAGRDFLIGIGRDNSDTCEGFVDANDTARRSTNMAVSIMDVRDLDKIALVERECVAVDNAEWVNSAVNWNLDQAHKMIGMHSDGSANVITVPVSYWERVEGDQNWWWGKWKTAVGLMSWDLSPVTDPDPAAADSSVIRNHGTVVHPAGQVKRSVIFSYDQPGSRQPTRRKMINLSDTHLSIWDITDLDAAHDRPEAVVELAPYYQQVYRFGDYAVEQVRLGGGRYWSNEQGTEFRVKRISGALANSPVVATFTAGQVRQVMQHGDNLVLLRHVPSDEAGASPSGWYGNREIEAQIYDLSDPRHPRAAGRTKLPVDMPYYRYWCGVGLYWPGYWFGNQQRWVPTTGGIAFLVRHYDSNWQEASESLVFLDLRQADAPKVRTTTLDRVEGRSYLGLVPDGAGKEGFYLNYRDQVVAKANDADQKTTRGDLQAAAYYAARWSVDSEGTPVEEFAVNVPGTLVRSFRAGDGTNLYLSQDYSYRHVYLENNDYPVYRPHFRIHLLRRAERDGKVLAALEHTQYFGDYRLGGLAQSGERLVLTARKDYYWAYRVATAEGGSAPTPEDYGDQLLIYEIAKTWSRHFRLALRYNRPTGTSNLEIMGIYRGRLFLNARGDGVLMVNIDDPSRPALQRFVRTLGWANQIVFADRSAFIPSGHFGIYQLDLDAAVVVGAD